MTLQRQAHAVISREVARIGRPPTSPVHPGYTAIVAKAHELSLPQCYATDITIHDRLLIIQHQPHEFAWRADTAAVACSVCPNQISGRWTISTPHDGSTARRCHSGGTAATLCRQRISIT
jgi:hypothetical protein